MGMRVHRGVRHVLKCSVLYKFKYGAEKFEDTDEWKHCLDHYPHVSEGLQKWEHMGRGPILPGACGPLGKVGDALRQVLIGHQAEPRVACNIARSEQGVPPGTTSPLSRPLAVPASALDHPVVSPSKFAVGEMVYAYWRPEGKYFSARVVEIKNDDHVVVDWTDWLGTVAVPVQEVKKRSDATPELAEPSQHVTILPPRSFALPAEWDIID